MTDVPDYLTKQQAADYLGVSIDTIHRRIKDGTIPAHKMGRLVRIDRAALKASLSPVEDK